MNIPTFFRFLNNKIKQYDNVAVNPFFESKSVILIWVEEVEEEVKDDFCK